MHIQDCWPTLSPIYDKINDHFYDKTKTPFFLLAGQNSGKTVLANVLMIERYNAGKTVAVAAKTLARADDEVSYYKYPNNGRVRPCEVITTTPRAGEKLEKRLKDIAPDTLLVVDSYEWDPYNKVDRIIDICLEKGADVLILSSQGLFAENKKYTPTVRYSTWELNPVMNESNYLFLKADANFERDYGGGKPYPY